MADNVAITPGSGATFRSDDVGGIHYQIVKLDGGGDGATIALTADSVIAGLPVERRERRVRVAVTPTISTAIYAANDCIGGILSFTSAVRASGGTGVIENIVVADKDAENAGLKLILFDQTIAGTATDQSPFDPTDAELANIQAVIPIVAGDYVSFADNSVASPGAMTQWNRGIPFKCAATTLFGILVATATPTYTSTSDLTITLTIRQD